MRAYDSGSMWNIENLINFFKSTHVLFISFLVHMESKKVNCDGPGFEYKETKISGDKLIVSFKCGGKESRALLFLHFYSYPVSLTDKVRGFCPRE